MPLAFRLVDEALAGLLSILGEVDERTAELAVLVLARLDIDAESETLADLEGDGTEADEYTDDEALEKTNAELPAD